jgi:hypothetical protein
MNALVGVTLVALHAVAFVAWAPSCRRAELVLDVATGLPPGLVARTEVAGAAPGLVFHRYTVAYRGGFSRSVGVAQLAGPFQDPARPACSGRVVVGQRLLDDGAGGPGTVASEVAAALDAELSGAEFLGAGPYERLSHVSLRWAEVAHHPEDTKLLGADGAPHGYVRATATIELERLDIKLVVALVPEASARELAFRTEVRAELDLGNKVLTWASDRLGVNKLATRIARRQLDGALVKAFAPPPPFPLPGGHRLAFGYCDGPVEIVEGRAGALPFAVRFETGARTIAPPRRGPARHAPLADGGLLAIDLDLDALNALLHELWRTGFLDQRLAAAGLDRRFNDDPIVGEFLTLRISPPRLALPPVVAVAGDKLQLAADARVTIRDGTRETIGRVWGALDFTIARGTGTAVAPLAVSLGALELSCERTPTTLVPCYADLVGALRDRGGELQGELTRQLTAMLAQIFVDQRVGASDLTADLVIRGVTPSLAIAGDNASLHLALDAALAAKRP